MQKDIFLCRICAWKLDEPPWGSDNRIPNYEICPCCGCEFGNDNYALESIREYRRSWLEKGAQWFLSKKRPVVLDLEGQLDNISEIYK